MSGLADSGDGIRTALERTALADITLRRLMSGHRADAEGLAVLAVGGYGRCDLTVKSDLDLIILDDGHSTPHEAAVRSLVQGLWDRGWSPGQTLMHLDDIDRHMLAVPDRASALLEARFVWGDLKLADAIEKDLVKRFDDEVWDRFVSLKLDEFHQRREKYGAVPRVVEPHLKAQAGGLRDLNHVFWIERARAALDGDWGLSRRRASALKAFVKRLARAKRISAKETGDLIESHDFILRLREALRTITGYETDLLAVGIQPQVGRILGFEGNDRAVMRESMKAAYRSIERIARFAEEFGASLAEYGIRRVPKEKLVPRFEGVAQLGNRLVLDRSARRRGSSDPEKLLELVDFSVQSGFPLAGSARHGLRLEIHRAGNRLRNHSNWRESIRSWLTLEKGFGARMRRLAELDALNPWLPEWDGIDGLTMGSYYHTFTVDEHTLRALEYLDRLPDDGPDGLPASLWESFRGRPWVYLSILFHDIAKGRRGDHSLEGVGLVRNALKRLDMNEYANPVSKLVRLHLRMEQVAFRRDASDPATIAKFAADVGNEDILTALYLLTVCDLNAVSKRVWTVWKGELLAELYIATGKWFQLGIKAVEWTVAEEVERVVQQVGGDLEAADRARRFLESMRAEYMRAVPASEIARHLEALELVEAGRPWRWLIEPREGYIIVTLITHDRAGLLAAIAGLLVSQGIGIREARIFTRDDGIVIDRFRAEDIEPEGVPLAERLGRIERYWRRLEEKELSLDSLLEGLRRRRRRVSRPSALIETEVTITPARQGYLVDVSGPDTVGLLYRLCSVFADEGFDVHAARVTGRLDGIMDAFLIRDPRDGLSSKDARMRLIDRLREAVENAS